MFNNVFVHTWMALPKDIRGLLVEVFDIKKTGVSEIKDDQVISDGYSNVDLQAITLSKMNEYIGSEETSFPHAWEVTCSKAKGTLYPPIGLDSLKEEVATVSQSPVEDIEVELAKRTITIASHDKTKENKQK